MVRVRFEELSTSDLIVGAVYEGGSAGNVGDDPIAPLLGVGNMGGFRYKGSPMPEGCRLVGLFSTHAQSDWPDHLDSDAGIFTYYGDNRTPGAPLLATSSGGNRLLKHIFDSIHATPQRRSAVPPVFVFQHLRDSGRDVRFVGLAAPGVPPHVDVKDLEVVIQGEVDPRITNYRAKFTILDARVVPREWIQALQSGEPDPELEPRAWRTWVEEGEYRVLETPSDEPDPIRGSVRFMIPTGGPDGWRALLAQPDLHWKTGRSARTMAHAWESADGWPPEIAAALKDIPALADFEPVFGFPELKTPLPGGTRASQTDLIVVASDGHRSMTMGVEGKVDETLGQYAEDWLGETPSHGKRERIAYLADMLGLSSDAIGRLRYQLLHRAAAAKIEASRSGSDVAAMIVHAWSDVRDGFDDFGAFARLLGVEADVGRFVYSEIADLWVGWIRGDDRFLEY